MTSPWSADDVGSSFRFVAPQMDLRHGFKKRIVEDHLRMAFEGGGQAPKVVIYQPRCYTSLVAMYLAPADTI